MSSTVKAHLAIFVANMIYGINYSVAKVPLDGFIGPFGFVFIRVSVTLLFLWILHAFIIRERVKRRDIPLLIICGVFGVACNQLLFFKGLDLTTEINAALIMITVPILVLVLSYFVTKEALTISKIGGIFLGACGAFVLIGFGQDFSFGSSTMEGDIYVLINATSYGLYLVLVKSLLKKYHPITVIKWVFLFGYFIVFFVGLGQFQEIEWNTFTWKVWASVAYVVVGTTILAYTLNIYALSKVNPSLVSIYIYIQPLIAAFIAIIFKDEHITWQKILSAVLIFVGVYLVSPKIKVNMQDKY